MYICICNGVTEKQIKESVLNHGVRRVGQLKAKLGVCGQCGKCARATKQALDRFLVENQGLGIQLDLKAANAFNYG